MVAQFGYWMDELRAIAIREFGYTYNSAESMDESAFLEFWEDGISPKDAMREETTP
jgi:hypothetical protein